MFPVPLQTNRRVSHGFCGMPDDEDSLTEPAGTPSVCKTLIMGVGESGSVAGSFSLVFSYWQPGFWKTQPPDV